MGFHKARNDVVAVDRLHDAINARHQVIDLSPTDLLDLPESLANVINTMLRRNGMKITEIAEQLGQSASEADNTVNALLEKGYIKPVEVNQQVWYKVNFGRTTDKTAGIWSLLGGMLDDR